MDQVLHAWLSFVRFFSDWITNRKAGGRKDRQTDKQSNGKNGQTVGQMVRQSYSQKVRQTVKHTFQQIVRQTVRQSVRQSERQLKRQLESRGNEIVMPPNQLRLTRVSYMMPHAVNVKQNFYSLKIRLIKHSIFTISCQWY